MDLAYLQQLTLREGHPQTLLQGLFVAVVAVDIAGMHMVAEKDMGFEHNIAVAVDKDMRLFVVDTVKDIVVEDIENRLVFLDCYYHTQQSLLVLQQGQQEVQTNRCPFLYSYPYILSF